MPIVRLGLLRESGLGGDALKPSSCRHITAHTRSLLTVHITENPPSDHTARNLHNGRLENQQQTASTIEYLPPTGAIVPDSYLKQGSEGGAVRALQGPLAELGSRPRGRLDTGSGRAPGSS